MSHESTLAGHSLGGRQGGEGIPLDLPQILGVLKSPVPSRPSLHIAPFVLLSRLAGEGVYLPSERATTQFESCEDSHLSP